jgi:alpha-tubulin suppressor-like RCC1 family protein
VRVLMSCAVVAAATSCTAAIAPDAVKDPSVHIAPPAVVQVASGVEHSCALLPDGRVFCWGIATATGRHAGDPTLPRRIPGPALVSITAGGDYTCGLTTDGRAYCWGSNSSGQLGDGTRVNRLDPTAVASVIRFVRLSAGGQTTCGIDTTGAVYCWGDGFLGELGDGIDTVNHAVSLPQRVPTTRTFREISSGFGGVCAVDASGFVFCWAAFGRLGRLAAASTARLQAVTGFSCGAVYDYASLHCASPTAVPSSGMIQLLSTGGTTACAIDVSALVECWGDGAEGRLGNGTQQMSLTPVFVTSELRYTLVTAGPLFACALSTDGRALCWGNNFRGYLGTGQPQGSAVPVQVSGELQFVSLSVGTAHVCGATLGGNVYCWGADVAGELGQPQTGVDSRVPILLTLPSE